MSNRGPNEKISVCIICGNEINNIERCLKSVTWADEIVVIDSYSTDGTFDVAKRYTNRVYRHEWMGYIGQKKLLASMANGPWLLFVDADEEVSPQLRKEIEEKFSKPLPPDLHGFNCPRLVHYLGRWIWHGDWYPDMKLRLFLKTFGECGGNEPHDRVFVTGKVANLNGPLNHYTYTDISDQIRQINRFSSISAKTHSSNRGSIFRLLFHPLFRFLKCYFFKRGFMDGVPGLIIAVNVAFGTFAKYSKHWELHQQKAMQDSAEE